MSIFNSVESATIAAFLRAADGTKVRVKLASTGQAISFRQKSYALRVKAEKKAKAGLLDQETVDKLREVILQVDGDTVVFLRADETDAIMALKAALGEEVPDLNAKVNEQMAGGFMERVKAEEQTAEALQVRNPYYTREGR